MLCASGKLNRVEAIIPLYARWDACLRERWDWILCLILLFSMIKSILTGFRSFTSIAGFIFVIRSSKHAFLIRKTKSMDSHRFGRTIDWDSTWRSNGGLPLIVYNMCSGHYSLVVCWWRVRLIFLLVHSRRWVPLLWCSLLWTDIALLLKGSHLTSPHLSFIKGWRGWTRHWVSRWNGCGIVFEEIIQGCGKGTIQSLTYMEYKRHVIQWL